MKTFVIGDVHGSHKALQQVLLRSNFNKEVDTLISLGDIVDGWSDVYECVEELLTIKNLIAIKGNHDEWFSSFLQDNQHPANWLQGGEGTLKSYCKHLNKSYVSLGSPGFETDLLDTDIPVEHINFFKNQIPYYLNKDGKLFVHGGFNRHFLIDDPIYNKEDILMWDRDLWSQALMNDFYNRYNDDSRSLYIKDERIKEVFIGHTTTMNWKTDAPMKASIVVNLDTGAGYNGKLTIMDIETKACFQSDPVQELYKDEKGRN